MREIERQKETKRKTQKEKETERAIKDGLSI